ncbi:MAG: eukaryotic-like serine/threonine-protein kinase [Thermodesulfobacteriota bacterium]|nr:eukaryotic-like serine/threonine-protein kinase [Thermodesulfobacteriota bacterium]
MTPVRIATGQRLISQGEQGDRLYVIQEGSCLVSLQRNGRSHIISRLKPGEILGEVAIVTGERRSADVDAETDMVLWAVDRVALDKLCQKCPDLFEFLTELATERLCSQKITAERSIGKYTITDVVAEGGWSIVYKGFHSVLKLPVAIKMLKHNIAIDPEMSRKFENEAEIIAGLNHENIVRVYDIEHMYRTIFIVMEYLDGVTLKHILENRLPMHIPEMLRVLVQICEGLGYAHAKGLVHQDVKPGNVFVHAGERVKIVDFGLASPVGGCSDDLPGTAFYMAPEQIEGDPVDVRTDIYSLGITAYEMATGHRPFPDDVCEVLKAHITAQTPDPREINPELPKEFSDFITKATHKNPAERYQSIEHVLRDLMPLVEQTRVVVGPDSPKRRKMMSLFLFYGNDQQVELTRALKAFSEELRLIGAEMRLAEFDDV